MFKKSVKRREIFFPGNYVKIIDGDNSGWLGKIERKSQIFKGLYKIKLIPQEKPSDYVWDMARAFEKNIELSEVESFCKVPKAFLIDKDIVDKIYNLELLTERSRSMKFKVGDEAIINEKVVEFKGEGFRDLIGERVKIVSVDTTSIPYNGQLLSGSIFGFSDAFLDPVPEIEVGDTVKIVDKNWDGKEQPFRVKYFNQDGLVVSVDKNSDIYFGIKFNDGNKYLFTNQGLKLISKGGKMEKMYPQFTEGQEVEILEYQIVGKKDWKKYPKPFLKTYYRESLRISWGK